MNNSIIEQIVEATAEYMRSIDGIKTVVRVQPRNSEELTQYSSQQLPLCVVKTRLPEVESKVTSHQNIRFVQSIDLYFYFLDNVNPDKTMIDLADNVWIKIFEGAGVVPNFLNGLALSANFVSNAESRYYPPYGMFRMTLEVTFIRKFPGG